MGNPTDAHPPKEQKNQEVTKLITKETTRYQKQGYGLILSWIQAVAFFYYAPAIAEYYWPTFLQFKDDYQLSYT